MAENRAHTDEKFQELIDLIKSGFPEGDPATHRAVHEGYIRQAEERKELWSSVLRQVVSGTVYSALAFAVWAVWNALKQDLHK